MKNQSDIKKIISKLPDNPGVYLFKVKSKKSKVESRILYIGKATSLRDRVRSYFNKDVINTRSPLISKMLEEFDDIEHIKTDSVLEALVLEAHLIKKHQPPANIKEKDNKSFNFVVITKEAFPRVLVLRGRELEKSFLLKSQREHAFARGSRAAHSRLPASESLSLRHESTDFSVSYSFGPFPNGSQLKEAMKIVRKMFPFRDKCIPSSGKPCFNRQIGLCPGVCTGEVTKEQYAKQIENIVLFFEGNKKKLMKNLEKQMQSFAEKKEFEKANIIKRTLFTLNHIQDVALIKEDMSRTVLDSGFRIESYDIAHMSGQNVVGVMTVVEDGEVKKSDYRKFKIRSAMDGANNNFSHGLGIFSENLRKNIIGGKFINDTKALKEVLERRLGHIEWRFPDLIVVDGGVAQKRIMEKVLKENSQNIPVVSVVKDERHRAREILGDRSIALTAGKKWSELEREILLSNAEAHRYAISFHKQLRGKIL